MDSHIAVCLPIPDRSPTFGWAVCCSYVISELEKLTSVIRVGQNDETVFDCPLLHAIVGPSLDSWGRARSSVKTVGFGFIEQRSLIKTENANRYDTIVCGSTWMQEMLNSCGITNTAIALQGVDYDIFKPGEPPPGKPFTIFSGSKFEYRKGQDIVLAAFKAFHVKHPSSRLIAAWGNHWPETMRSMEQSKFIKYLHISSRGGWGWKTNILAALQANGIPLDSVVLANMDDHAAQVNLYRKAHIGLFPNRGEAGTNLVMCEAIASGLPVIAIDTTGHRDILAHTPCYKIDHVRVCSTEECWWEPTSVGMEQILSQLEYAYHNRAAIREIGLCGAETIKALVSWEGCAKSLLGAMND